jgi:hypothetical protein
MELINSFGEYQVTSERNHISRSRVLNFWSLKAAVYVVRQGKKSEPLLTLGQHS